MKYAVWFVRLLFASWMIPAGVNHFLRLFAQPLGSQPLSRELILALLDSHLFDIVKVVELVAGIAVLTGFLSPLALLLCMPVSFCVFWWDAPLEGWGSRAAQFGYSVLLANVLLCLAYVRSYKPMFALRSRPSAAQLALAGRLVFGGWLLANGVNHFLVPLWTVPAGHEPLAAQLMAAFMHSGLLDVAMVIQSVAGALLLAGVLVPAALCVVMPVSTCALYWALALERDPLLGALALVVFAVNGLLMLAHLEYYRGALQRHATTLGEAPGAITFEAAYSGAAGRLSRGEYLGALVTVLLAALFYVRLVPGRTGMWSLLVLVIPAAFLLSRRLADMGRSTALAVLPAALMSAAFGIWLRLVEPVDELGAAVPAIAMLVAVAFALWGCVAATSAMARPARL